MQLNCQPLPARSQELKPQQVKFLETVRRLLPEMQEEALHADTKIEFPYRSFDQLYEAGLYVATLPETLGGMGFGHGEDGATGLLWLLALLGEGSLAVARLYEAHVNALQLIFRYGTPDLASRAARDAADRNLFALWVTDRPTTVLTLEPDMNGFMLTGSKEFCSGAGIATRALVTAKTETGSQMLVVALEEHTRIKQSEIKLGGMRATMTGSVEFIKMPVLAAALLGMEGDYLREPTFSAGAWRSSAAAFGGLTALVKLHRTEIRARHRQDDTYQRMRFGQVLIQYEAAHLWMEKAALCACVEIDSADAIVAYVNLARMAVEVACLKALQLTQRSLGLRAFMAGTGIELVCRDLATYLRQPAPDETLDKAAQYFFTPLYQDHREKNFRNS